MFLIEVAISCRVESLDIVIDNKIPPCHNLIRHPVIVLVTVAGTTLVDMITYVERIELWKQQNQHKSKHSLSLNYS